MRRVARRGIDIMQREFTQVQADRHNSLAAKGWALIHGRILLHDTLPMGRPGWVTRWQLRRAIRYFLKALTINPDGWSSMWALGKIHQRLGDQATAFGWFARAHALKPDQPDVAREASLAALDVGEIDQALALCRAAAANRPDDAGLICNLALAFCLSGHDADAERCAAETVRRDPGDTISSTVLTFVQEVSSGVRRRPRRLDEVFPH